MGFSTSFSSAATGISAMSWQHRKSVWWEFLQHQSGKIKAGKYPTESISFLCWQLFLGNVRLPGACSTCKIPTKWYRGFCCCLVCWKKIFAAPRKTRLFLVALSAPGSLVWVFWICANRSIQSENQCDVTVTSLWRQARNLSRLLNGHLLRRVFGYSFVAQFVDLSR